MAVDLMWYFRRLQRMRPAEIVNRASVAAIQRRWRKRLCHPPQAPYSPRSAPSSLPSGWSDEVPGFERDPLITLADRLMDGKVTWLGHVRTDLLAPNWLFDGAGGPEVSDGYAFDLPLRDPAKVGSIKLLWELNRLQHLTVLAAAYSLTGEAKYAERVRDHLESWLEDNQFMSGPNWTSGIELGVRLISLAWTRRLLDGWDGARDAFENNTAFASSILGHGEWLMTFESKGSSANNHVLAEAAGLVVAGYAFDWGSQSVEWRRVGTELLARELVTQTFPSGVNRELATAYDGFVFELAAAAAFEIQLAGDPLPGGISDTLVAMADVHAAMLDSAIRTGRQGDGDNGLGVLLGGWDSSRSGVSRLAMCAGVVEPLEWWPSCSPDVRSVAFGSVFGPAGLAGAGLTKAGRAAERPDVFSDAGMVFLRGNLGDSTDELWCRFDAGEFAFLSIGSHAHADQLAIELRHNGTDIVSDPGTFTYLPDSDERTAYRSTMAHATVEIDGEDQAKAGGAFLWLDHPSTELESVTWRPGARSGSAVGSHDGYAPSIHRREVAVDLDKSTVTIADTITEAAQRKIAIRFPLGPTVSASVDGFVATLTWPDLGDGSSRTATVDLDNRFTWSVADSVPDALGAYAPEFGTELAASTLIGRFQGSEPSVKTTTLFHF